MKVLNITKTHRSAFDNHNKDYNIITIKNLRNNKE